jgi:hypothetical protein
MHKFLALAYLLGLLTPAHAPDNWTGKTIQVKESGIKFGRKFDNGLVRDGAYSTPRRPTW